MPELIFVRHAQASFGAADYDVLSERGHRQSRALGLALKAHGTRPDALFMGAQRRHRETMEGIAETLGGSADVLPGLNEFDFRSLLDARFGDTRPPGYNVDRRAHFRTLRETVLMWQAGELDGVPEPFPEFRERVHGALDTMAAAGHGTVLAVSSGGPISLTIVSLLGAPLEQMINVQLQMKNCAVTRVVVAEAARYLHTFNETPHIDAETVAEYLTYS
ncbi:histidine phosphatase family protein [Acuticoccus sp.]|uniref:histidine phosphatase family protein n=1 Tax=Acuticoccus sp. TaxID=1904378 RepID=UPI003B520190